MATVLITGGTGMIGKALTKALLDRGYSIIILTRKIREAGYGAGGEQKNISYAVWDMEKQSIDADAISKADHIIHLAGANLGDGRWTKKRKTEIVSSRVDSGKLIVESLKKILNHVKTVISSSAIGYYGPDQPGKRNFEETDPPFNDFLGTTCRQWEESIEPVKQLGKRLVILRTGLVLSKANGVIPGFITPLKFGVATILGNGKQMISWIHIDDLVKIVITAIENENISGVYNAVAPTSISNKEFVLTLAKTRNKFFIPFYVPSFVLKMVLGEMSIEVLKSATVSCEKIRKTGFQFQYPMVSEALKNL